MDRLPSPPAAPACPDRPGSAGGPAPHRAGAPLGTGPLLLDSVLGQAGEPWWHDRLHAMEHRGAVEYLLIPEAESPRRRMRITSDRGRDCAVALPRDARLEDGTVLHCTGDLAIVVRLDSGARLRLVPDGVTDALRLGHWCGNLHWKVVFGPGWMEVVMEGPEARYRDRLQDLAGMARFTILGAAAPDGHAQAVAADDATPTAPRRDPPGDAP